MRDRKEKRKKRRRSSIFLNVPFVPSPIARPSSSSSSFTILFLHAFSWHLFPSFPLLTCLGEHYLVLYMVHRRNNSMPACHPSEILLFTSCVAFCFNQLISSSSSSPQWMSTLGEQRRCTQSIGWLSVRHAPDKNKRSMVGQPSDLQPVKSMFVRPVRPG